MATMVDQPTRSEIVECLTNLARRAAREFPKTRTLTTDEPTPWDSRHETIDALLYELERVGG